jgi:VWFA-related protein
VLKKTYADQAERFLGDKMRRAAINVACAFACLAQNVPHFGSDASLATVDVLAYDRNTQRPIAGLTLSDFEILEDGFPLKLVACESAESALDAVLVIEVGQPLPRDRTAARARAQLREFVGDLAPEDRVAVLSFASKPKLHCALTGNSGVTMSAILEALRSADPRSEGRRLRDATLAATELFPRVLERGRRRAVMLVHDQGEARSAASTDRVVAALLEKSVVFYGASVEGSRPRSTGRFTIGIGSGSIPPKRPPAPQAPTGTGVDELANATGGEILRGSDAIAIMHEGLRKLRTRYLLYFRPPAKRGEARLHRVTVGLSKTGRERHPAAHVRGQREYLW